MQPDQQSSGDYGYDLVHQDVAAARPPAPPRPSAERATPAPPPGRRDLADDLAYDEAHDF